MRISGFLNVLRLHEVISLDHLIHDVLKRIKPVLDYFLDTHSEAAATRFSGFLNYSMKSSASTIIKIS